MALHKGGDERTGRTHGIPRLTGVVQGSADYLAAGSAPPQFLRNKGMGIFEGAGIEMVVEKLGLVITNSKNETTFLWFVLYFHDSTIAGKKVILNR
jgi:hypothetical protein